MSRDSDYEDDKRYKMVLSEAEDILEDEARSKEFWAVDYSYDNGKRLQRAIDVVYNSIPGNNYEVDYMVNQNGSRLIIRCVTCSKELTSYDPFVTHEKGKPHNKVRQQQLNPRDPNLKGVLKRQPHDTRKDIFEEDTLEDLVDRTSKFVLGMQFVYKEVINGKDRYTCQLCMKDADVVAIKTSRMFSHVTSKCHLKKYLRVKFGYIKVPHISFDDEVENIQKMEGKIHSPIVDFTKQILAREVLGGQSSDSMKDLSIKQEFLQRLKKEPPSIKQEFSPQVKKEPPSPGAVSCKRRRSDSSSDASVGNNSLSVRARKAQRSRRWSEDSMESSPKLTIPSPPPLQYPTMPSPDLFPLKPEMVDKGTSPCKEIVKESLADQAHILRTSDARDQLLEDPLMQQLLHETLLILNDKLISYYKRTDSLCWDEQGNCVSKAFECAYGLRTKHIQKLDVITDTD